jgi:hypothetical protein
MKKILITILAVTATLGSSAQIPGYVPTNGLIGYWPFNGNANDESVNNLNANVLGGTTLTTDRFGNVNASYDFDYSSVSFGGQTDEVYIPYNSILNSTNISVSVWVYPRSYFWTGDAGNPNSTILNRFQYTYSNPSGGAWGISFNQTSVSGGISGPTGGAGAVAISNTPLTLNTWHHIVMTYDGANVILYIDGSLSGIQSHTAAMNIAGNSGISIGESNQANGFWQHTDGKIDDIGIWNRALTQQEITTLYNTCTLSALLNIPSQTVTLNSNVKFVASVSEPNTTYQWQSDIGLGFQNLSNAGQYSGATNDTLTISSINTANNNQSFRCIVSNGSCSDTTNGALLIVCQTGLTTQPQNQDIDLGTNATFTVTGNNIPNYQWQSNLGFGFQNLSNAGQYSGANTNTLTVSNTTSANNNQSFRCVISSNECSDTSAVAILTIKNNVGLYQDLLPAFSIYPNPANENITISLSMHANNAVVEVYDMYGKLILAEVNKSGKQFDLNTSTLASGAYYIKLTIAGAQSRSMFIKN